jgi:hypothetical protein
LIGKFVERRPSTSTKVEETPKPRSETATPPAEKRLWKPTPIEPPLSAETVRMASAAVVMPAFARLSAVSTETGEGVSVLVRRNSEPVTTTSSDSGVADVAVAAGVGYGENGEGFVRIAMVENEQRIRQAARNIKAYLKSQGVNVPPSRED